MVRIWVASLHQELQRCDDAGVSVLFELLQSTARVDSNSCGAVAEDSAKTARWAVVLETSALPTARWLVIVLQAENIIVNWDNRLVSDGNGGPWHRACGTARKILQALSQTTVSFEIGGVTGPPVWRAVHP